MYDKYRFSKKQLILVSHALNRYLCRGWELYCNPPWWISFHSVVQVRLTGMQEAMLFFDSKCKLNLTMTS